MNEPPDFENKSKAELQEILKNFPSPHHFHKPALEALSKREIKEKEQIIETIKWSKIAAISAIIGIIVMIILFVLSNYTFKSNQIPWNIQKQSVLQQRLEIKRPIPSQFQAHSVSGISQITISKALTLLGLGLGIISAALMFYYPPRIQFYTEKGAPVIPWIGNPKEEKKSVGKWQVFLSKLGPGLLILAFLVQLAGVLLS